MRVWNGLHGDTNANDTRVFRDTVRNVQEKENPAMWHYKKCYGLRFLGRIRQNIQTTKQTTTRLNLICC